MAVVEELIRTEDDKTISFGDYTLAKKTKKENCEFDGDLYKVKTFKEITKLEKNGLFVYESVPGTAVNHLNITEDTVSFEVEGPEDASITIELEESTSYDIIINGKDAGRMKTNLGGKLSLSVELEEQSKVKVEIKKVNA